MNAVQDARGRDRKKKVQAGDFQATVWVVVFKLKRSVSAVKHTGLLFSIFNTGESWRHDVGQSGKVRPGEGATTESIKDPQQFLANNADNYVEAALFVHSYDAIKRKLKELWSKMELWQYDAIKNNCRDHCACVLRSLEEDDDLRVPVNKEAYQLIDRVKTNDALLVTGAAVLGLTIFGGLLYALGASSSSSKEEEEAYEEV